MSSASGTPLVTISDVSKAFDNVKALRRVGLGINPGEAIGLVGHNGAGKSTLMNVLAGFFRQDEGSIELAGIGRIDESPISRRNSLGIRCVSQELSLCPNLTVAENTRIFHPSIRGWGWRMAAGSLIAGKLDEIFSGHGVSPDAPIASLPLGCRQMVEVARAFTESDVPVRLAILDEPTSSLDEASARQLLNFIRRYVKSGGTCIFVSHKLDEIAVATDHVVIMKDGAIVRRAETRSIDRAGIVEAMGDIEEHMTDRLRPAGGSQESGELLPLQLRPALLGPIHLRPGEIIGLAGLAGSGQSQALLRMFNGDARKRCAFVAGDRQKDGVFPNWPISRNIGIQSLKALTRFFLISGEKERLLANRWKERIGIRAQSVDTSIRSLSGGNQQKVLLARALGSVASIILMDDPTRGVDIGTKSEIYRIVRGEAERGRSFLWYSTEIDELQNCDRVLVFQEGVVAAILDGGQITRQNILNSSFAA